MILVTELLGARRVAAFRRIWQDEAARLLSSLASSSSPPAGQPVNVVELLAEFIADSSVRAIFGNRLTDRAAFLRMRKEGPEFSSLFKLRDLFLLSRLVRMLPRSGKAERHWREVSRLIGDILRLHEERRAAAGDGDGDQDMIDVLLRIQKESGMRVYLTPGVIKSVVMENLPWD
ncbi:hypothetical protein SEVIR_8G175900v4 [Setaria viridis]|uniref:Uncharacterized protein n=1 Tax=Setaria viridis TaxID=4556 RepID=A0A4U6TK69_SETVI|nr:hypothetical protein SEVIR_8G175900v2 [Setaria viridis]